MSFIAVDVGLKRIGVAISYDKRVVLPLRAIIRKNRNQAAKELDKLLEEKECKMLIVGMPIGGSSEEEMTRRIKHFIGLLNFDKEIKFQDEYGSSCEAKEMLQSRVKLKRDGRIDSVSAIIILKRYLGIV